MFDGGNRLWIGKNDGLWVFDPNLTEIIHHFTTENSSLPSDQVLSLAYDGKSGQVYILTSEGLVSYQSVSTVAERKHTNVKVFPNPVSIRNAGTLGITGLAENAQVKITTVKGHLVQQITANGGTARWGLRDLSGRVVNPGVYLFFSSSDDGEANYQGKFAVTP